MINSNLKMIFAFRASKTVKAKAEALIETTICQKNAEAREACVSERGIFGRKLRHTGESHILLLAKISA